MAAAYDVAIAYRIYPRVSRNPPVHRDDKLKLAALCLDSFREGLGGVRAKILVLLDGCPPAYEALFRDRFRAEDLVISPTNSLGNQATFGLQIDWLMRQQEADTVYFAEDDYFYCPGALEEMVGFLKAFPDADFVSPYDHPDAYQHPIHLRRQELRPWGRRHWRSAASTCLTFLTRRENLARTRRVFQSYLRGNLDVGLWMAMTKLGICNPWVFARSCWRRPAYGGYLALAWLHGWSSILFGKRWHLWVPIPSLATHMEAPLLAPAIDWQQRFQAQRRRDLG